MSSPVDRPALSLGPPASDAAASDAPLDFDLLTDVVLPLLLFVMVGSLLFFIVDVHSALANGPTRLLRWVFFCFTLAVVGIARIKARDGSWSATPFALGLTGAMGLFGWMYSFGGGALGGGYGGENPVRSVMLLYATIAFVWWSANYIVASTTLSPDDVAVDEREALTSDAWEAQGARAEAVRCRPHPGRAVIVLSAVAVAIFGLGHRELAGNPQFAGHAFWCMVVYSLTALAVLSLTALSGLQLYARSRGTRLPASVPAVWLALAGPLVAGIVAAALVSPRLAPQPNSWAPRVVVGGLGQTELSHAPVEGMRDSRRPGATQSQRADQRSTGNNGPRSQSPQGQQADGQQGQGGKASGSGQGAGGEGGSSGQGRGGQGGQGSQQGRSSQGRKQAGTKSGGQSGGLPHNAGGGLAGVLGKLLGVLLVLAAVGYGLWRLAKAGWWRRLRWPARTPREPAPYVPTRDPFVDPFGPRSPLRGQPPAEVVRHVYRAFGAYCELAGHARRPDVTAREFLAELPPSTSNWRGHIEDLTWLYEAAEYTPESVDESCLPQLRECWAALMQGVERARG